MIYVLSSGHLNTIQDLGRTGHRAIGVGTAGAMDRMAFVLGNRLVGNAPDSAGIELTLPPFRARFTRDTLFALTGADFHARLDDVPVAPWSSLTAKAGQRLELLYAADNGSRAYLCVQGGVNVPKLMGSRSTDLKGMFGGLLGRSLRKGDRIHIHPGEYSELRVRPGVSMSIPSPSYGLSPQLSSFTRSACLPVRVLPAAEYEWLDEASAEAFWEAEWKVTPESNRMGYRLAGTALRFAAGKDRKLMSHGILSGVIQLPPSRQPIVQLHDSNTVGGYPKIGVVVNADLRVMAQVPLGARIRFVRVDYDEAVLALRQDRDLMTDRCAQIESLRKQLTAGAHTR